MVRLKPQRKKANIIGIILGVTIIMLFAGQLIPGIQEVVPAIIPLTTAICDQSCDERLEEGPNTLIIDPNGTATIIEDPNPNITSKSNLYTQLVDAVQSPILPGSDSIIINAIITLEDSAGNQKISAQQTELFRQALVEDAADLVNLRGGKMTLSMFIDSDEINRNYAVTGKIYVLSPGSFPLTQDIESVFTIFNIDSSGITDDDGDFVIETDFVSNFEVDLTPIFINSESSGGIQSTGFAILDPKIIIGESEFGFSGLQTIYTLDLNIGGNMVYTFNTDSTEELRFLPNDSSLTIASVTNDQFESFVCEITAINATDCSSDPVLGPIISFVGPGISNIEVSSGIETIGNLALTSGEEFFTVLSRSSNYTVTLGAPLDTSFNLVTPSSQKDYSYKCWQERDQIETINSATLMKTVTLATTTNIVCDFPTSVP